MRITFPDGTVRAFSVPDGIKCIACAAAIEEGFSYIPEDKLKDLVHSDEVINESFNKARDFKRGAAPATWPDNERVDRSRCYVNQLFLNYDGFLCRASFQRCNQGKSPEDKNVPPVDITHPVTGEAHAAWFLPSDGPDLKLQIGFFDESSHGWPCMPSQVYPEQGGPTLEFL